MKIQYFRKFFIVEINSVVHYQIEFSKFQSGFLEWYQPLFHGLRSFPNVKKIELFYIAPFLQENLFLIDNFIKYLFIYFERESPVFRFYRYVELYISGSCRVLAGVFFCARQLREGLPSVLKSLPELYHKLISSCKKVTYKYSVSFCNMLEFT